MINKGSAVDRQPTQDFEALSKGKRRGLLRDAVAFLMETKKFWLIPIVMLLVLFGILVVLAATGAAPFIYTLF